MHIKVAPVCWQGRKVEAQKSIIMKFIEKPGEFIWQHREDRIVAHFPCITMLDLSIIKGIKSSVLAPAANQCVHDMASHLRKEIHNMYNVHNANKCNNQTDIAYFGVRAPEECVRRQAHHHDEDQRTCQMKQLQSRWD
jgi:hypothetical protein